MSNGPTSAGLDQTSTTDRVNLRRPKRRGLLSGSTMTLHAHAFQGPRLRGEARGPAASASPRGARGPSPAHLRLYSSRSRFTLASTL